MTQDLVSHLRTHYYDNWDGEGAKAVTESALTAAMNMLKRLAVPAFASPEESGGMCIEPNASHSLIITVGPSGMMWDYDINTGLAAASEEDISADDVVRIFERDRREYGMTFYSWHGLDTEDPRYWEPL